MEKIVFDDKTFIWKHKLNLINDKNIILNEVSNLIETASSLEKERDAYTIHITGIDFMGNIGSGRISGSTGGSGGGSSTSGSPFQEFVVVSKTGIIYKSFANMKSILNENTSKYLLSGIEISFDIATNLTKSILIISLCNI
jgi:hypothetical protein